MFRFALRDLLWLTALIAIAIAWSMNQRKLATVMQERDEAVALWHDAATKWVEATRKIPPGTGTSGGLGGGASIPMDPQPAASGGGLGGAITAPSLP
jgi:hypothetical protein